MTDNENTTGEPKESKEAKFKRLAEPRMNNAIAKIGLIGNLASSSYDFNADQVEKILSGLRAAVDEVDVKFKKGLNRKGYNDEGKFRL